MINNPELPFHIRIIDLLVYFGFCKSLSEARQKIRENAVKIHCQRICVHDELAAFEWNDDGQFLVSRDCPK